MRSGKKSRVNPAHAVNSYTVQLRDTAPDQRKPFGVRFHFHAGYRLLFTPRHGVTARMFVGTFGGSGVTVPGKEVQRMDEYAVRKYQIHCPECGHEFVWDTDVIEREQERLKKRHLEISGMIAEMKAHNDPLRLAKSPDFRRLKAESTKLIARLTALKTVKQNNHKVTDDIYNRAFKDVVMERYGDEVYCNILDAVKERLKPIRIEKLMTERVKK